VKGFDKREIQQQMVSALIGHCHEPLGLNIGIVWSLNGASSVDLTLFHSEFSHL